MRNISETEELCAVAEANKRLKTEESSNYLPFDLMVEIFFETADEISSEVWLRIEALGYLSSRPLLHGLVLDKIIFSPEAVVRLQQGRSSLLLLLLLTAASR
ncbi:Uncharacterized protein Rs2_39492 [Raphanus sativus]|nr:Uncharacterized protein Rs2_39492 [Raphanus sativus]